MIRARRMVLLTAASLALAGCGGGGSGSESSVETTETGGMASSGQSVSSDDCAALTGVMADFTVGGHEDEVMPRALDITATDYVSDRDFLAGYLARAPEAIRADVELLGRWVDGYATAAQAAGVASGVVPTFDQLTEINTASHLDSREQDLLPPAIEALQRWANGGCTGARPVIEAAPSTTEETETVAEPSSPLAKAAAEAELGESVDEVAEAVSEVMSRKTERELGSPPLGSEVRNCRKERNLSENSRIAPGGTGFVCEIWYEGELWRDGGIAVIDAKGEVFDDAVAPRSRLQVSRLSRYSAAIVARSSRQRSARRRCPSPRGGLLPSASASAAPAESPCAWSTSARSTRMSACAVMSPLSAMEASASRARATASSVWPRRASTRARAAFHADAS